MRHLHLDPIGGIAGDMFAAALLDAEPDAAGQCLRAAEAVSGVPCRLLPHRDAVLTGARFVVEADRHRHAHTDWSEIRARLHAADLPEAARRHALGIFAALAEAEARVHGIAVDDVTFHEVGAADSIADIVAAGWLIAAQGEASFSVAPLPLGGGRVATAHGMLPVPAPATALLLQGFATIDDGVGGERVTPTGAAILRHLAAHVPPPPGVRILRRSGTGFGTRVLPGMPNVLRVLVSDRVAAAPAPRDIAVIEFEVDDQSPEDLSIALDHIRRVAGVLDAVQMPAFGKKGRVAAHIQVLADLAAQEAAIAACFAETTTIGLRTRVTGRRTLPREAATAGGVRVKRAARADGVTAKAESDDFADIPTHAARQRARWEAEHE